MRLTKKALTAINNSSTRLKLAMALTCTEQWIIKMIKANKVNGPLTTVTALNVISEATKLKQQDILDAKKVVMDSE